MNLGERSLMRSDEKAYAVERDEKSQPTFDVYFVRRIQVHRK